MTSSSQFENSLVFSRTVNDFLTHGTSVVSPDDPVKFGITQSCGLCGHSFGPNVDKALDPLAKDSYGHPNVMAEMINGCGHVFAGRCLDDHARSISTEGNKCPTCGDKLFDGASAMQEELAHTKDELERHKTKMATELDQINVWHAERLSKKRNRLSRGELTEEEQEAFTKRLNDYRTNDKTDGDLLERKIWLLTKVLGEFREEGMTASSRC